MYSTFGLLFIEQAVRPLCDPSSNSPAGYKSTNTHRTRTRTQGDKDMLGYD